MPHERSLKLDEACSETGLEKKVVVEFIHREWIVIRRPEQTEPEIELDDEDLARARLILQLREDFGVNNEGIPLILHLLDQLHAIRRAAKKTG